MTLCCMAAASDALVVLQGTNPIYNLLPDIFSSLSAETRVPSAHFQVTQKPCNPDWIPVCSEIRGISYRDHLVRVRYSSASEKPRGPMATKGTPV